jgi:hypothetical protein
MKKVPAILQGLFSPIPTPFQLLPVLDSRRTVGTGNPARTGSAALSAECSVVIAGREGRSARAVLINAVADPAGAAAGIWIPFTV